MAGKMYITDSRPRFLSVLETLVQIAVIAVLGLFLARYIFYSHENLSKSMEPSIMPDSVVFINRAGYTIREPERFDVAAFQRSDERSSDVLVRRIIGLPGETVRIYRGTVYINNEALDLSGYISEITSDGIAENGIRLQEDEYFVLGDMPANSEDSRSSTVGAVKRSRIIGKAWITFRSITEFNLIR
ncbi:MAG: signal peptidase I [Lachnospiraceae bacterium]|nr:signal peptidase I [Lachnospiraceae bacterium]